MPAGNGRRGVASSAKKLANTVSKMVVNNNDEPTWEELQATEQRRRAILQRSEEPFNKILLYYDGTVLTVLATDPLMYLTMLMYIGVRIWARFGLPEIFTVLGGADIGVIGVFLSFFLVFFVVTSNKRFDFLYGMSMACKGRILDVAQLSKATLPRQNALRLVRYMNAAHIAGYVGLSNVYTTTNFYQHLHQKNRYLTKAEYQRIQRIDMNRGGSSLQEIISWCMAQVQHAQNEGVIDGRLACQFRDLVLELQRSFSAMYNFADQPISFFYVHFICLLSALYLPLFAISFALSAGTGEEAYLVSDIVTGLIVFLQSVFVIGLRVLGQKMADPYGLDVIDLSVMHYCNFTWLMSNRILAAQVPEPALSNDDDGDEERICRERATIGEAWEESSTSGVAGEEDMSRLGMESVVHDGGTRNKNHSAYADAPPHAEGKSSSGYCAVM